MLEKGGVAISIKWSIPRKDRNRQERQGWCFSMASLTKTYMLYVKLKDRCIKIIISNLKIWDSGWFRDVKIERSVTGTSRRSIALPQVSPTEGIQSLGEGFLYCLGPKGDYHASWRGQKSFLDHRNMKKWHELQSPYIANSLKLPLIEFH